MAKLQHLHGQKKDRRRDNDKFEQSKTAIHQSRQSCVNTSKYMAGAPKEIIAVNPTMANNVIMRLWRMHPEQDVTEIEQTKGRR